MKRKRKQKKCMKFACWPLLFVNIHVVSKSKKFKGTHFLESSPDMYNQRCIYSDVKKLGISAAKLSDLRHIHIPFDVWTFNKPVLSYEQEIEPQITFQIRSVCSVNHTLLKHMFYRTSSAIELMQTFASFHILKFFAKSVRQS